MEPTLIEITARSQEHLEKIVKTNGGGNLVKVGGTDAKPRAVDLLKDIEAGAAYVLVGGQQEAVRLHRTWTQVADKATENEAAKVVTADTAYGKLDEYTAYDGATPEDRVLVAADGTKMEIDGLAVNGSVAVVVEAKHHAHVKHISIVKAKAKHVARIAAERPESRLGPIKRVIPVLASNLFSASMQEACEAQGVGVVKPSGARLGFAHHPPLSAGAEVQPPARA
jgi:hypothetical protein